ncbi:hypothetical protein ACHAXR_005414 [Thalassiosira sp. AJA248-18]
MWGYEVWGQMDLTVPDRGQCHMPQIQYLQEIHDEAPTATFIMNKRNVTNWINSMRNWKSIKNWNLRKALSERFVGCRNVTLLNASDDQSLEKYFVDHVQRVRDFVDRNPTHTLVEVDIEDPNAGCMVSELFGIDSKCWKQKNTSEDKKIRDTRIREKKSPDQ